LSEAVLRVGSILLSEAGTRASGAAGDGWWGKKYQFRRHSSVINKQHQVVRTGPSGAILAE
jgi:hypothetical protein